MDWEVKRHMDLKDEKHVSLHHHKDRTRAFQVIIIEWAST